MTRWICVGTVWLVVGMVNGCTRRTEKGKAPATPPAPATKAAVQAKEAPLPGKAAPSPAMPVAPAQPRSTYQPAVANLDLAAFYAPWFVALDPWKFESEGKAGLIEIDGQKLDRFIGGINSLVYDESYSSGTGGLVRCATRAVAADDESAPADPIEALTGLETFTKTDGPFRHLNPDLVVWGYTNLIPAPDVQIHGFTCQTLYDHLFRRFFRLMARSYLWLTRERDYQVEQQAYAAAVFPDETFMAGSQYLRKRYADVSLEAYDFDNMYTMDPPLALGFWLRRGIDGSHDELWEGLERILSQYDSRWLAEVTGP